MGRDSALRDVEMPLSGNCIGSEIGGVISEATTCVKPDEGEDGGAMREASSSSKPDARVIRKWPEDPDERSSRLSQAYQNWTYSYMGSILAKGSKQMKSGIHSEKISQQDLFVVPQNMQSPYLSTKFKIFYESESEESMTELTETKKRLMRTLWHLAAPTFIPAGFCELSTVLCQVALPLMVRQLLQVLEKNPNAKVIAKGMPCELLITGAITMLLLHQIGYR